MNVLEIFPPSLLPELVVAGGDVAWRDDCIVETGDSEVGSLSWSSTVQSSFPSANGEDGGDSLLAGERERKKNHIT